MAVLKRGRNVIRVAGAAGVAAPYLRELISDSELRDSARTAVRAVGRLYEEMSADERLRDLLFSSAPHADRHRSSLRSRFLGSARTMRSGRFMRSGKIMRSGLRWARIGSFALGTGVLVGALAYPRSRRRITRAVGDARGTVTSIAGKAGERTAATAGSAREKITSTVQSLRPAA